MLAKDYPVHWSRLPSQPCRVPNRLLVSLASGSRGCLALRFSPDGLFLVAATQETPDTFPLLIYQVRHALSLSLSLVLLSNGELSMQL